ncbi:MAG: IS481 family transposase, partial [Acidimicrobiaceae bacterium]|nr:IS481 family transposase [Acidimicrobiaceae bacterium]
MSKRRLVILSVVLEGRSQAEVARQFLVSEATVSRWVSRYRADGEAAFEPRSRRPANSPNRITKDTIGLIIDLRRTLSSQGLDAGPATIGWHLEYHHQTVVSTTTIRRHLLAAGLIKPNPRKRPKSSLTRFQADLPNECWQTDMTHIQLATSSEVLTWLDDHSRYALSITVHTRVNVNSVVTTFDKTVETYGLPASVLSDNAMYYTARFARGGRSGPNQFEQHLAALNVDQKHSKPNRPTTCGRVERFQQTLKQWLHARPPAATSNELQALLDQFRHIYNHHRPHRSIGTTPTTKYGLLPKATPTTPTADLRIRNDKVDRHGKVTLRYQGKLHHIGIGRRHAHTPVIMLINDRHIKIIATT